MQSTLNTAATFLVHVIFNLYTLVLLLRIIFFKLGVDWRNPVSALIIKVTNPVVIPVRRVLPPVKNIDIAALTVTLLFIAIKLILEYLLKFYSMPHILGLVIWTLGDFSNQFINIFFYAIIINIILSWIQPGMTHPLSHLLFRLTDPILAPARRLIPPIGGFDLSPLPVLIGLKLLTILISYPLITYGVMLANRP